MNPKKPTPRTGSKKPAPKTRTKKPAAKTESKRRSSNGAARQSQRRTQQIVNRVIDSANLADRQPRPANKRTSIFDADLLKIVCLGGQDDIGSKNMIVLEYGNDAIVIDCGLDLAIDLPGINYAIPDTSYLTSIKNKLRGYVITHGHLDHIGGLAYVLGECPAPVYGSLFTIGMIKNVLNNQPGARHLLNQIKFITMNMDAHENIKLGAAFKVELIRITHSIPESSAVTIETPVGRLIHTGDFRLDPEPLDRRPSDIARLESLGKSGVTILLSESTNAQSPGRVPTEQTLETSIKDIVSKAPSRIFVACFSTNINRIQMIINAAVDAGRQVAFDGRSMIQNVELAVKLGVLKIPKGTIVSMANLASLPDDRLLMLSTGAQGEIGAALQKASVNEHKYLNIRPKDTIVISARPIPGNENNYARLVADLTLQGGRIFKDPTWSIDGAVGPLHVSGHGQRDELKQMISMTKPKFLIPIHASSAHRQYHCDLAVRETNLKPDQVLMVDNGDLVSLNKNQKISLTEKAVPWGSVLIDDGGQMVPSVVVKDRLLLTEAGLVVIVLTIDRSSGQLLASPDIITRGFIHIRDNEELMKQLRSETKRAVNQRFSRVGIDRFKTELKDHVGNFLHSQTRQSPIVIPVVNVIAGANGAKTTTKPRPNQARPNPRSRAAVIK